MTKILIIDDDPSIQLLLNRTLARQGYEVLLASSGEEGLEIALEHHPALVICDWLMPGLNGLEVCRHIKSHPELTTTFFILLTSLGSVEDRVRGLDAGSDDFLCKPIGDTLELKARIRAGLRIHQLSCDLKRQKQQLETELAEAADYVTSILPEPFTTDTTTIDVRFIPSRQLGGDCFDFYWLDADHLVIYLLDVSGHGLRAALPSISVLNLLRSQGLNKVDFYQPSQVLYGLNQAFQMNHRNEQYLTIWYGVYNQKTRQLVYASAGHPPAVLLCSKLKSEQRLTTKNFPIGMFPESQYKDSVCSIPFAAQLYIFSDGIYEIDQPDETIWGLDSFIDLLKSPPRSQQNLDRILLDLNAVNPKGYFEDDLSIIQVIFH